MKIPIISGLMLACSFAWSADNDSGNSNSKNVPTDILERHIENSLATDPSTKTLEGLREYWVKNPDQSEITAASKFNIDALHNTANHSLTPGLAMLAFAVMNYEKKLPVSDSIKISISLIEHLNHVDFVAGIGNPMFTYWKYFDQWDDFVKMLPEIGKSFSNIQVVTYVLNAVPDTIIGTIVKSDDFNKMPYSMRCMMLDKGTSDKVIDIKQPEYQRQLPDLFNDPDGDGALLYIQYYQGHDRAYLDNLTKFITKYYKDDMRFAVFESVVSSDDLKRIDLATMPISDDAKKDLIAVMNGRK